MLVVADLPDAFQLLGTAQVCVELHVPHLLPVLHADSFDAVYLRLTQRMILEPGMLPHAKRQADEGVDFICINSDYGFNTGPFISPKHFAEFVTPYFAEIVGAIHDLGLPAILHSDGNLNAILDQQDANEERIRESVRYCVKHGGIGSRYIFSSSNCIFAGMPLRSYHIMLDEYDRCCRECRA